MQWATLWTVACNVFYIALAVAAILVVVLSYVVTTKRYTRTLGMHARRSRREHMELDKDAQSFVNSMQAEQSVQQVLEEEGWTHVFLQRRVPVPRQRQNREIDVIAVGPVILVVEVKNWQGNVWSNGHRWFQQPNPKSTLEFEDIQSDNALKAAALRRYIENTRRVQLPDFASITTTSLFEDTTTSTTEDGHTVSHARGTWYTDQMLHKQCGTTVIPVVVFTHPRVKLDPATVGAKKHVFTLDTFRVFAREALRGNVSADHGGSWWRSLLSTVFGATAAAAASGALVLDAKTQAKVAYGVDVMRSWDCITLHDGTLINGDVQRVDAPTANCSYERKHLLDIRIVWYTDTVGFLKTLLFNAAGSVELVLTSEKRHAMKKKEKKPRNAAGNIVFPLVVNKSERNKSIYDRLTIKEAGKTRIVEVRLVDIKAIALSHHLYEVERHL